jgi:hypothetical protein
MLVGLILLRRNGGGMFGLTPILWRQVWWRFCLAVILSINFNLLLKAVIWLSLAIVSGIPPAVSPATLLFIPCLFISVYGVGDSCFE